MSNHNFLTVIDKYLSALNIKLISQQINMLESIGNTLLKDPLYKSVSKISGFEEIAIKHFLDSLAPFSFNLECLKNKEQKIIDLGTGAGFPALPVAVMLPNSFVTAVDSRKKSAEFVNRIAVQCNCNNVKAIHARIEELGQNKQHREKYDLVICRALAELRILLEYCLPLVKIGGYLLFYKGPKLNEEVLQAENALNIFGIKHGDYKIKNLTQSLLPFNRSYFIYKKKVKTSSKYPRRNGMPRTKPL